MECIFCRIISGEIPGETVYQDDRVIAIRDISPQAPTHILLMPRAHIPSAAELKGGDFELVGLMVAVANELAKSEGVSDSGYRLVINNGPDGGQEVPHLHLHLLGGRALGGLG